MNLRSLLFLSQTGRAMLAASLLAATGLFFSASSANAQPGGEMKPLAVITLSGYDALIEDIDFVGSLIGKPGASIQLEQMILFFTQQQGLAGLDKSRPIGVVVMSDGAIFGGGLCLPVTDFAQLLGAMEGLGVTSEDQGDGVLKINTPQGQELYAREINDWAFLAPAEAMLKKLPDNPIGLFAPLAKQYDLGIRAYMQNIPEMFRNMAISGLEAGMQQAMQPLSDESDDAFQARKEMAGKQIEKMKRMINDLDEVTIGLAVDSKQQRTFFDVAYTAVAGSDLADQITQNSNPKTNYAGFFQPDAAMMMSISQKVTEADIVQVDQALEGIRKQLHTSIDEESTLPSDKARGVMKSALDDFLDALKSTLQAGTVDGGAVLNLAPNAATFVAGGFVADPSKIESGLKKLVELAEEQPDFPGIQWNSDQHADIRFHTISMPVPEGEEEPRKLFGETVEIAIGIGKQSVYFALGRDCLAATKDIIDHSTANPEKSVVIIEMTFSLGQIMELAASFPADERSRQLFETISEMLTKESSGRDHMRMVAQPINNGIRMRFELEEGALKAIGMGAAASMEAQPAEAGF